MSDCIVLGAGMVGLGTALALQKTGLNVALVDRRQPGEETSYGNAGLIQVEAVEPYAFPFKAGEVLSAMAGLNNKMRWQPGSMHRWALPLLSYMRNSAPGRYRRISQIYATMIREAAQDHAPLIEEAGAQDLVRREGFWQVHRTRRSLDRAAREARRLRQDFGVESQILGSAEFAALEPNLKATLPGAIHWRQSWTCTDPGGLVAAYAQLFVKRGGSWINGDATTLKPAGAGWRVEGADGIVEAQNAVIALGPWSGELLRGFGYKVPLFFKRGYHRHYRAAGPQLPVVDQDRGVVMSPMKAGLRLLTGAEMAWLDSPATEHQIRHAKRAADDLFEIGEAVEDKAWSGNRPCMPGMLPVVGRAPRHKGLWFNFGHGHQGFTLGPTTGRMLAAEITGTRKLPCELELAG